MSPLPLADVDDEEVAADDDDDRRRLLLLLLLSGSDVDDDDDDVGDDERDDADGDFSSLITRQLGDLTAMFGGAGDLAASFSPPLTPLLLATATTAVDDVSIGSTSPQLLLALLPIE